MHTQSPPPGFWSRLRHTGPGLVMSAAVVGSGELIATTALGAKAGFVTMWIILASCLIKVALQVEFGKNAILTGQTAMQSFNALPGWRIGRAHWSIWFWLSLQVFKFLQVGGIVGGVAYLLTRMAPILDAKLWAAVAALSAAALVYRGNYKAIEKLATVMVVLFSISILLSLGLLQSTDYAITWQQLKTGLTFQLPPGAVFIALGAFGITGVGGDEIMYYTYWCKDKGYAAYTGADKSDPGWGARARGWIHIMMLDALLAMMVYTLVTCAFYLLGAALLHQHGEVPEGYAMVETLSLLFTTTFGPWAKALFLGGAFAALYSTLFTATAGWSRVYSDALHQLGWWKMDSPEVERKAIQILSWFFPISWCLLFYFVKLPVWMILIGGVATTILLLLVVYGALSFRYRNTPQLLQPTRRYDVWLWASALAVIAFSILGLVQSLRS